VGRCAVAVLPDGRLDARAAGPGLAVRNPLRDVAVEPVRVAGRVRAGDGPCPRLCPCGFTAPPPRERRARRVRLRKRDENARSAPGMPAARRLARAVRAGAAATPAPGCPTGAAEWVVPLDDVMFCISRVTATPPPTAMRPRRRSQRPSPRRRAPASPAIPPPAPPPAAAPAPDPLIPTAASALCFRPMAGTTGSTAAIIARWLRTLLAELGGSPRTA